MPFRASSFKFLANLFNALYCVSEVWEDMVEPLRRSFMAVISPFSVRPASFKSFAVLSFPCKTASNRCSTLTNSSLKVFKTEFALSIMLFISRLTDWAGSVPVTFGSLPILSSILLSTKFTLTLFFLSRNSMGVSSSLSNAFSRCSVSMFGFRSLKAICCAF